MGDPRGFLNIKRKDPDYRPKEQRVKDFEEVEKRLSEKEIRKQASRCMDCGIPFCHGCGCPLGNIIPEWNDLVYNGFWQEALDILLSKNSFPEFTGRVCPAPCETACTVGLNDEPVTIRQIELALIEKGFAEGYITPSPPKNRTGKRVAVVGSGPAGLAAAETLNKMGHIVTVYEKDNFAGGLLRYGIPDFKLDKKIVQRRIDLMSKEGVRFETGLDVGIDISAKFLFKRFDAICLANGAKQPRDLKVPGRELKNIFFAMQFLKQQNKKIGGEEIEDEGISAKGKNVLVIGGGDTGSDCIGTSIRQGAKSVTQIEIMPQPPEARHDSTPWPDWPYRIRTSSSHKEGCKRMWNIKTTSFEGKNGEVKKANAVKVEWEPDEKGMPKNLKDVPGSEFSFDAELVLLALGFTGPDRQEIFEQFELECDKAGNIKTDENLQTSLPGVFAAGDIATGASLVVRAIGAGKKVAKNIDSYLKKL